MKKVLVALTLLFASQISAQEDGPKVVVFNQSEQTKPTNTVPNLLKISILEPLSGDVCFYYERVIGPNTSFEVGAGFTVDDFFGSILFEDDFFDINSNRNPLIGHSFAAGFRYYPYAASDEFYFAPEFKYRYYHNELIIGSGASQSTLEESRSIANFRITAGYNLFFDDKIFMDFFAGVGLAMNKYQQYESVYNETTFEYDYLLRTIRRPRPWLTIGIKFGFGF